MKTESDLGNVVFPDLNHNYCDKTWLCQRAILAPRNYAVNHINFKLLSRLLSQSFNTIQTKHRQCISQLSFNSLDLPGVPSHIL